MSLKVQSLKGKKALITGGSRGIGRATAIALAKEGVELGLIARSENSFEAIRHELNERDATFVTAPADVANEADIQQAVKKIENELGDIDILINNAAIAMRGKFIDLSTDDWKKVLDTNVLGIVYTTKAVLPAMIHKDRGDIINISSMSGLKGTEGSSAYSASKFAVIGLSEALMQEVRRHNIRVSTLTPSLVETDLVRGKSTSERQPDKFTQAEDVAEFIVSQLKLEQRTFIKTAAQWGTNPF
ncbi:3-ketoacyl-ACP reductase [Salipaludibacillus agaradhaerens]|jgi:3-oxoacyl-[acyl-carrier protein] reductase|uniref:3-ketoacyl-ACP reductase n=1 Tax=Salipaludibacillus agaradhaerens TaxID=76935 RepID=UPI0009973484|nr:3-ketoacyl-ACP reductase [Salipaludibacillus agaradhaerens]MCR6108414.1 3-ketoacyl-ACP reductase [Salipaludibacillus agaradhaerens]MCR6120436.1 3-ketoacyl-ACP reductase [Salipaludibacillus agaradhaerens]UJW59443.1 3-ketoacyl-ACP reductase [Bacillus sp. A116_S68]